MSLKPGIVADVETLIEERSAHLKAAKEIEVKLKNRGVWLKDTPQGTEWLTSRPRDDG